MSQPKKSQLVRDVSLADLERAVTSFVVDRQARGLSPRTVEYYGDELRYLQAYLERRDIRRLADVTADQLRKYLLELGRKRNPGGVHAGFRAIRAWLNWCWPEYGLTSANPIVKVAAPRVPQLALHPVSLIDLRALLATCKSRCFTDDRDRALLLALLDTGCRASEILALDLQDVNLETGAVTIPRGKGGRFRTAFLGAKTRRELVRYLRHTVGAGPLWTTSQGRRLTYGGLRAIMRRRAKAAGVDTPSPHSFRRAFPLGCLRGGMDVYALQKLMGHAELSVLRRYLQQTEADLQAAHRRAGPVDNLLQGKVAALEELNRQRTWFKGATGLRQVADSHR